MLLGIGSIFLSLPGLPRLACLLGSLKLESTLLPNDFAPLRNLGLHLHPVQFFFYQIQDFRLTLVFDLLLGGILTFLCFSFLSNDRFLRFSFLSDDWFLLFFLPLYPLNLWVSWFVTFYRISPFLFIAEELLPGEEVA